MADDGTPAAGEDKQVDEQQSSAAADAAAVGDAAAAADSNRKEEEEEDTPPPQGIKSLSARLAGQIPVGPRPTPPRAAAAPASSDGKSSDEAGDSAADDDGASPSTTPQRRLSKQPPPGGIGIGLDVARELRIQTQANKYGRQSKGPSELDRQFAQVRGGSPGMVAKKSEKSAEPESELAAKLKKRASDTDKAIEEVCCRGGHPCTVHLSHFS